MNKPINLQSFVCEIDKCPDIQRLKTENKKLKKQNEILLGQLVINDGEDITVQISQSQFEKYNELKEKSEKYKQALEEIREIANEPCLEDEDCETCNENCMSKDIIDKINEVLKDE